MFLALAAAAAADFSGIWTGTLADRNGDLQDLCFRFTEHDGSLAGKMYGDNESVAITDCKIEGDRIAFVVTTELNGSITRTLYSGTLVNGQIQLTRSRADAPKPDAAKADASAKVPGRANSRQTVVLRRL